MFTCLLNAHPVRLTCNRNAAVGGMIMGATAIKGGEVFKIVEKTGAACGTASVTEFSVGSTYCVTLDPLPAKYTIQAPEGVTFASGASGCTNKQFVPPTAAGIAADLGAAGNNQEFTVGSGYATNGLKVVVGYRNPNGFGEVSVSEVQMTVSGGGTVTPENCVGSWGTCTNSRDYSECKQTYKVKKAKVGTGTDCEAADGVKKDCTDGDCSIDCKPTFSACSKTGDKCEKTVSSVIAKMGKGTCAAANAQGEKVTCAAGSCGAAVDVTASGYVVDNLCWDRCTASGKPYGNTCAPDKARLLTNPEEHTIHCMIDLPECKNSGFIMLEKGADGVYTKKYEFDAATNTKMITWMETFAKGDERLQKKVFMKATGTVKGMVLTATLELSAAPKTSGVTAFSLMAFMLLALFH